MPAHRPSVRCLPLDAIARRIQNVLTPDLLTPEWRARNAVPGVSPLTGHCYVATEAYWHAAGRAAGFQPHVVSGPGYTHWWLQDPAGRIIDLTAVQFTPGALDYAAGRGCGFLTRAPSRRAQIVLQRTGLCVVAASPPPPLAAKVRARRAPRSVR